MPRAVPEADLQPGEVRLGAPLPSGHPTYERLDERGEVECGYLTSIEEATPPGAAGVITLAEEHRPGVRRVREYIPFTAKGPAMVASDAYRAGWDGIYGRRRKAAPS